jgi:hypothetical protein
MYVYLSKDGLYMDRNLNLILIKMEFDRVAVDELIIINKDSMVYDKLDIDKDCILISPNYHTCINKDMDLIKITPDYMSSTFVDYIKTKTDSHTRGLVLNLIDNLKTTKIHKRSLSKDIADVINMKDSAYKEVNSIANIFMPDILDFLFSTVNVYDNQSELCNYLHNNRITYSTIRKEINDYLNSLGFLTFRDAINEHIVIIKNLDRGFKDKTIRPLTIYTSDKLLGLAIGPKGKTVSKLKGDIHSISKHWIIPYISVKSISERPTETNIDDITSLYLKLITNMLKVRYADGIKYDRLN